MSNRLQPLSYLIFLAAILLQPYSSKGEVDMKLAARLDELLGNDAVLRKALPPSATYVARVIEVKTGRELYLHDPDRPVAPASNAKLANVAAGLDRFGTKYVWRTYLAIDGEDLWLIGTGDPSCGDARLERAHGQSRLAVLDEFADALIQRGVTHFDGKLIIDDGMFDDERVGKTWPKSELTEEWSAPLTALSLNGNCLRVTAFPDHLEVLPKTAAVRVIDQTRKTGNPGEVSVDRDAQRDVFTVNGLVTKKVECDPKAITDPGLFFADALRLRLQERGIAIAGATERSPRDAADRKWGELKERDRRDARVAAVHETPIIDVINRIDKQSQNLFADAFCKLQGWAWDREHGQPQPGNWKAGGAAVHNFLRRMKIDDSKYVLVDGSGLSADNRVTARLISDLLLKMRDHPNGEAFRNSLSICGKDGTLDDRMMDIAERVHGKSGTIDGVKALSGYVTTRQGETLVFSMIYNEIPPKLAHHCQDLLDNACRILVEWPNTAELPATRATPDH